MYKKLHRNKGVRFDFLLVIKIAGFQGNIFTYWQINFSSFTSFKFNMYPAHLHYITNGLAMERGQFSVDGLKHRCA